MKFLDLVKERFRRSNSKRSFHKIILENLKILPRKGRRKEKLKLPVNVSIHLCIFTYIYIFVSILFLSQMNTEFHFIIYRWLGFFPE